MELHEQVFRKLGYVTNDHDSFWRNPDGKQYGSELPYIDLKWEVVVKYLLPFMVGIKWSRYSIIDNVFTWHMDPEIMPHYTDADLLIDTSHSAKIKDNNLAEAACKAFMKLKL